MPDINTLLLREAAERVEAFDAASARARAAIREAIDACRAAAAACERVVAEAGLVPPECDPNCADPECPYIHQWAEAEGRAHDAAFGE